VRRSSPWGQAGSAVWGNVSKSRRNWFLSSVFHQVEVRLLTRRKSSGELNAVKNNGVPAKDSGETGPIVIKEYCLEAGSNALCGSLNDWYSFSAFGSPPTSSFKEKNSLPRARPKPKKKILSWPIISLCKLDRVWLMNIHPSPYFLVVRTASRSESLTRSCFSLSSFSLGANLCASSKITKVFKNLFSR